LSAAQASAEYFLRTSLKIGPLRQKSSARPTITGTRIA